MTRNVGWMTGLALITLLLSPGAAAAARPPPDGPAGPYVVVKRVEVPVHDPVADLVRMQIAAALGATVAASVTAARLRRRDRSHAGPGIIDLTAAPLPAGGRSK